MSTEMKLYLELKKYLVRLGADILGGQPPSGTDHLPVVEIKSGVGSERGSKDAYKPDLLALINEEMFVFEIKPRFSNSDAIKLTRLLDSQDRQLALWAELKQRRLLPPDTNAGFRLEPRMNVAIVNAGPRAKLSRIWQFLRSEDGFIIIPPHDHKMSEADATITL